MKTELNLIPPEYIKARRTAQRLRTVSILLAALALACAGGYFFSAYRRLTFLRQKRSEALLRQETAFKEAAALEKSWQSLSAQGKKWAAVTELVRAEPPALLLLDQVLSVLPAGGSLEYVLADSERCRIDVLLPELSMADTVQRRLPQLPGHTRFSAVTPRNGRMGLPVYRFDALREKKP